jgi:hypothetical protein
MSTDRELLELAAKAVGLKPLGYENGRHAMQLGSKRPLGFPSRWNPLLDDGDAFRLAVKLNIGVMSAMYTGRSCAWLYCKGKDWEFLVEHGGDAGAATRLAIVRVAAAIGKSMP